MVLESGLQRRFDDAADAVSGGACKNADVGATLHLYGLYCRVRKGVAKAENKPASALLDPRGAAKYDAWNSASALSEEQAAMQYIAAVEALTNENEKQQQATNANRTNASGGGGGDQLGKAAPQGFMIGAKLAEGAKEAEGKCAADSDGEMVREVFVESAENGDVDGVNAAVEAAGKEILSEKDEDGLTGLMRAADRGHLDVVRAMIAAGAPVDVADTDGQTALHYAVMCGHAQVVAALVMAGSRWSDALDSNGNSPAELAEGQEEILTAVEMAMSGTFVFRSTSPEKSAESSSPLSQDKRGVDDDDDDVALGLVPAGKGSGAKRAGAKNLPTTSSRVVLGAVIALSIGASAFVAWRQHGHRWNGIAASLI